MQIFSSNYILYSTDRALIGSIVSLSFLFVCIFRVVLLTCELVSSGNFAECELEEDQQRWSRHNVFLLYDCGAFTTFVELLNMEIE